MCLSLIICILSEFLNLLKVFFYRLRAAIIAQVCSAALIVFPPGVLHYERSGKHKKMHALEIFSFLNQTSDRRGSPAHRSILLDLN